MNIKILTECEATFSVAVRVAAPPIKLYYFLQVTYQRKQCLHALGRDIEVSSSLHIPSPQNIFCKLPAPRHRNICAYVHYMIVIKVRENLMTFALS